MGTRSYLFVIFLNFSLAVAGDPVVKRAPLIPNIVPKPLSELLGAPAPDCPGVVPKPVIAVAPNEQPEYVRDPLLVCTQNNLSPNQHPIVISIHEVNDNVALGAGKSIPILKDILPRAKDHGRLTHGLSVKGVVPHGDGTEEKWYTSEFSLSTDLNTKAGRFKDSQEFLESLKAPKPKRRDASKYQGWGMNGLPPQGTGIYVPSIDRGMNAGLGPNGLSQPAGPALSVEEQEKRIEEARINWANKNYQSAREITQLSYGLIRHTKKSYFGGGLTVGLINDGKSIPGLALSQQENWHAGLNKLGLADQYTTQDGGKKFYLETFIKAGTIITPGKATHVTCEVPKNSEFKLEGGFTFSPFLPGGTNSFAMAEVKIPLKLSAKSFNDPKSFLLVKQDLKMQFLPGLSFEERSDYILTLGYGRKLGQIRGGTTVTFVADLQLMGGSGRNKINKYTNDTNLAIDRDKDLKYLADNYKNEQASLEAWKNVVKNTPVQPRVDTFITSDGRTLTFETTAAEAERINSDRLEDINKSLKTAEKNYELQKKEINSQYEIDKKIKAASSPFGKLNVVGGLHLYFTLGKKK